MIKLYRAKSTLPVLQVDEVNVIHDVEIAWFYESPRAVTLQERFRAFTYPSNVAMEPGSDARRRLIDQISNGLFVEDELNLFVDFVSLVLKWPTEVTTHVMGDADCYKYNLLPIAERKRLIYLGDHGQFLKGSNRYYLHFLPYKLPGYNLPFLVAGEVKGVREWVGVSHPYEFSAYDNIVAPKIP